MDFLTSGEQLRAIHSLGDLPMVVLASGVFLREAPTRPEAGLRLHEIWQDLQRDLANLSSNSVYMVVESSGHSGKSIYSGSCIEQVQAPRLWRQ